MKEVFVTKKFKAEALATIATLNRILDEYQAQGYRLSLRQLYYQMVARDYIPNNVNSYKNLGGIVSDARQAGLIDWAMIEDRGRDTSIPAHWKSVSEIMRACANQFRIDKWLDQPWHIECMVEKDALSGVLEPVCAELDIGITANKGYSSSSTMYEIGKRLAAKRKAGKKICVIYLGDHDPSGIDMTRDVGERLEMYSRLRGIEVVRLALNYDQVELWQPPENPAKQTDSRFASYEVEFGASSWELDAVEPRTLAQLVRAAVEERRDEPLWDAATERQASMRQLLTDLSTQYDDDQKTGRSTVRAKTAEPWELKVGAWVWIGADWSMYFGKIGQISEDLGDDEWEVEFTDSDGDLEYVETITSAELYDPEGNHPDFDKSDDEDEDEESDE